MALDCEMVGTEEDGSGAMCARVCIVDTRGSVLLSTFVAPDRPITDHRTKLTGVDPGSLVGAPSLREVRTAVLAVLNGSKRTAADDDKALLVGHDLQHDLECLGIKWPGRLCRDTARHPPLQRHTHAPFKLRTLAADHLGESIQREGVAHDPREDAWAAMRLYLGASALCRAHRGGGGESRAEDRVGRTRAEDRVGRARATARGCAPTAGRGGRSRRSRRRGLDAGAGISSRVRGFRAPDARGRPGSTRLPSRLRPSHRGRRCGIPPTRTRPRSDDDDGRGEDIMAWRGERSRRDDSIL